MANGTPRVRNIKSRVVKREHPKVLETLAGHFYRQIDPRLKPQVMDSRLIQEDHSAIANLSETFINKQWNPARFQEALGRRDEFSDVGE